MKKRAAFIIGTSIIIFLVFFFVAYKGIASIDMANIEIDGVKLGKGNTIEQKVPDEIVFAFIGVDFSTGDTDPDRTRSDTLMVMKVNFKKGTLDLVSVPRDTQILLDGNYHKINAAHAYQGTEGTMKALRELLKIDIDYYVEINFSAVEHLVDAMGGVEVDSPVEFEHSKVKIKKGKQKLNGKEALVFVRARHPFGGADQARIQNQQKFLRTLMSQLLRPENVIKLPRLFEVYQKDVKTNIPVPMAAGYLTKIENLSSSRFYTYTVPGYEYDDGISWYIRDQEALDQMVNQLFKDYKLDDVTIEKTEF